MDEAEKQTKWSHRLNPCIQPLMLEFFIEYNPPLKNELRGLQGEERLEKMREMLMECSSVSRACNINYACKFMLVEALRYDVKIELHAINAIVKAMLQLVRLNSKSTDNAGII